MANQSKVIDISFKSLLKQVTRELGFLDPLYGSLNGTCSTVFVVIQPKEGNLAYFKVGEPRDTLLQSEENAAEKAVRVFIEEFQLCIDDVSSAKKIISEHCFGLFLHQKEVVNNPKRKINNVSASCEVMTSVSKKIEVSGPVISINFIELLTTIIRCMKIHATRVSDTQLGYGRFVSWIGVRLPGGSQSLEWILGEEHVSSENARQDLAKKAIRFLEPIYQFEVRDVNYKAMKKAALFSILQRESYLTTVERTHGFTEGERQSSFLPSEDCVTPESQSSRIPALITAPHPPKKRKPNNLTLSLPPNVPDSALSAELALLFKPKQEAM